MIAMARYVRAARTRAVLVVVSLVVALIGSVVPSVPAQASGGRAAILFPFGGKTWLAGEGPGQHHHFWNAWATDLHAPVGTPVQARFASSDGNITLSVAAISPTCAAPNNAGRNVTVNVYVNGGFAGEVIYGHLNNVQVGTGPIPPGTTLGYLNNWAWSSCWQDNTSDGVVHTHIEVEKGCYRSLAAWSNYPASTPLGLLKTAYPNNNVGACDENEVNQVITGPSPDDMNGDGRADLVLVGTGDPHPTGSGRLEVHALDGASGYSTWLGHWATIAGYGDSTTRYVMGDVNGDGRPEMVFVAVGPTGSGRLEVHALDGATTYQSWLGNWATAAGYAGANDKFTMGDVNGDGRADLVIVAPGPTGSGRLETHVLNGATGFSTWLGNWATAAGYGNASTKYLMAG